MDGGSVYHRSLCMPSFQYACCPLVQADKQHQPEHAREIATQDIEEPVFALIHPGKAYQQEVERGNDLKGNQRPTVTPCARGPRKTQIQQKAIKEHHMAAMTRGKAIIPERNLDMNKSWGGSRTNDVITNECINRIADTHGQSQKDGLSIPAQEEYPGEGDSQDDTRGRRVVERADKVKNEEDPWPVGQALNSSAECQFDRPGAWMVMHKQEATASVSKPITQGVMAMLLWIALFHQCGGPIFLACSCIAAFGSIVGLCIRLSLSFR